MTTIDVRLLDCQSIVEVEENFNRVLSISDNKVAEEQLELALEENFNRVLAISDSKKADEVAALLPDATLPETVTAFNSLLTELKAAGLMEDNAS